MTSANQADCRVTERFRRTVVLLLVGLALVGCSKSPEAELGKGTPAPSESTGLPEPGSANRAAQAQAKGFYKAEPAKLDIRTLPANYGGVNLEALSTALLDLRDKNKKDELETTEQHRQRIAELISRPILGSLLLNSTYGFTFDPSETQYDADRRVLSVQLSANYCCVVDSGVGTHEAFRWSAYLSKGQSYSAANAFGAKFVVDVHWIDWYGIVIRNLRNLALERGKARPTLAVGISIEPEEARRMKSRVRLLLVCKLEQPIISVKWNKKEPTVKRPIEEFSDSSFIHVKVLQVYAYDPLSGTVYSTLRPPNT